eukprot:Lankesteria_metandrocarpae@DN2264_c1_g1_i1.p1
MQSDNCRTNLSEGNDQTLHNESIALREKNGQQNQPPQDPDVVQPKCPATEVTEQQKHSEPAAPVEAPAEQNATFASAPTKKPPPRQWLTQRRTEVRIGPQYQALIPHQLPIDINSRSASPSPLPDPEVVNADDGVDPLPKGKRLQPQDSSGGTSSSDAMMMCAADFAAGSKEDEEDDDKSPTGQNSTWANTKRTKCF